MQESADLIITNANVITCDPIRPHAEAVAVKGNLIRVVGSNREAIQVKGPRSRVIDAQGRTVIPGFNDAHCHFFSYVRKLFSLDLSPESVHSIADIKKAIQRKAHNTPKHIWISGTDYNEFYLEEGRHPNRYDLDEAAPENPVIITHRSLHACVLNSRAMRIAGITNETEEPPGGIIERDLETGEPNGILYEMIDYVKKKVFTPIPESELAWGIKQVDQKYLSMGITSFCEATVTNNLKQWQSFKRLKAGGKIKSRIYFMPGADYWREFQEAGLITGSGDIQIRIGSVKIVLSQATGQMMPDQIKLNRTILAASRAGFQVAVHAVERDSVNAAAKAFTYAQRWLPRTDRRFRIEHCSECPSVLRKRLGNLKAVIVSQPPFMYYHGERYLSQVKPQTRKYLYPFKSLIDSGMVVAGSSDSPVVPNSPLMGIYAAVSRRAEPGQIIVRSEGVSAQQALEMYTINAAYASFEENMKGSLTPGKLADIVFLDGDPLQSTPEQIKNIQVEKTIIGGKVVWDKDQNLD